MIIIGERINSTRAHIQEAIKARNTAYIVKEALSQIEAGAHFVDVNCAMSLGDEVQDVDWVISVIQSEIKNASICIDSPNYLAIERAAQVYKPTGELFINSITGEDERIAKIVPLAVKRRAKLIALTMDESGMPDTAEERFEIAKKILIKVRELGLPEEDIYFDPLIRPVSTEPTQAKEFLRSIPLIKSLGRVNTVCGLSNVSYGLPNRKLINSVFLTMAIQAGLDAAIIDPTDRRMMPNIAASGALLGTDEYCAEYIGAFRSGKLT
jgi:5-methyltetrahydrofolate--homocysteine methyltransferase